MSTRLIYHALGLQGYEYVHQIGRKPVWLMVEVPRVHCLDCGSIRRIRLVIAESRRSYTRAFAQYVLDLTKMTTLKDVSLLLGVGHPVIPLS